jgi:hypothetical protein
MNEGLQDWEGNPAHTTLIDIGTQTLFATMVEKRREKRSSDNYPGWLQTQDMG